MRGGATARDDAGGATARVGTDVLARGTPVAVVAACAEPGFGKALRSTVELPDDVSVFSPAAFVGETGAELLFTNRCSVVS